MGPVCINSPQPFLKDFRKDLENWYSSVHMSEHLSDIDIVLSSILSIEKSELFFHQEQRVTPDECQAVLRILKERCQHIPLQHLLGSTNFYGLELKITPATFIPRPETEIMVEKLISYISENCPNAHILDLCTGSGCISIALAKHCPDVKIIAIDLSEDALEIARLNAETHQVSSQITFFEGNLFKPLSTKNLFDCIVSNPPYIPETQKNSLQPEVRYYEPQISLYGGHTGLDISKTIIEQASSFLTPEGKLFLEIGDGQGSILKETYTNHNYRDITVHNDYNDFERIMELTTYSQVC